MKKINFEHFNEKRKKECLKEAHILKKLRHTNIIKYYSSFVEGNCLFIIMEYADNGDMHKVTLIFLIMNK